MPKFIFTVTIECETASQADIVMAERHGFDEDYGFEYSLDYDSDDPKFLGDNGNSDWKPSL